MVNKMKVKLENVHFKHKTKGRPILNVKMLLIPSSHKANLDRSFTNYLMLYKKKEGYDWPFS